MLEYQDFDEEVQKELNRAAHLCADALREGKKLLFCGNGGSAEFSNHMACEFVCKLEGDRKALNAISLCSNLALITAIANDYGFEYVFARQLEANAQEGDILFCISTSGKSPNVLEACKKAKELGVITIGMCGAINNKLNRLADVVIPSVGTTAKIQEHQLVLGHRIVSRVEELLGVFETSGANVRNKGL